ncbi:hypothetical protein HPB52_012504 [Rhipicephalus sanguineus]|uniref:Sulfotransferase domain-containing protein n=1 Tax=Rhipicephalus sanguineus TaxID=34632 RepID=A0A9D4QAW6_RHISA|nr:hypothetical protein HPB52_012504 [Rhipicephalus sanguineus]
MDYKPRDGDIFVVTYPKCGTNWTTFIVYNILSRGKEVSSVVEFRQLCPFIDMSGAGAAMNPSRRGPIVTHLPLEVFPPVDNAKYIYVARNPYDCAVVYGDYFDHLLPWYERRNEGNVLFLTYEQLKADTRAAVLKLADFLGEDHGATLREDDALLEKVLYACSLENMKLFLSETPVGVKKLFEKTSEKSAAAEKMNNRTTELVEMHEGSGFVRKGIVGDWKNYFTEDQIKETKEWIARKTQGSDVMTLWSDCYMP